jgi:uncharacterized cupin superfamily protein
VRSVNVFEDGYEYDPEDPPGYRAGAMLISEELSARGLAVKSFVLAPGETVCPYHYEYEEEWLLVLDGTIVLRAPEREPAFAVYPDSDKIGAWPGNEADEVLLFRRDGNVGYYDGEV